MSNTMPHNLEAEKEPLSPCSSTSDLKHDASRFLYSSQRQRQSRGNYLHWFFHFASIISIASLLLQSQSKALCQEDLQNKPKDGYTPILEGIVHEERKVFFEGGFDGWTPFAGPPTDAAKEAWWSLEDMPYVNLTAEQMVKMGHSLDSVQFPEEVGGGYMATAEGPHHLHCLNILWRDHYIDQYEEVQKNKAEMPILYEKHYEHCINALRQRLEYLSDIGVFTYNRVRNFTSPFPNFVTTRTCKNYGQMMSWIRDNSAYFDVDWKWDVPEDAVRLADFLMVEYMGSFNP